MKSYRKPPTAACALHWESNVAALLADGIYDNVHITKGTNIPPALILLLLQCARRPCTLQPMHEIPET